VRRRYKEERMNPKVRMIVEEFFPKIIETHIRTRSSIETAKLSLDRYRIMGLQAVRNLPPETQQENQDALDSAYRLAIERLLEFHAREVSPAGAAVTKKTSESP